MRLWLLLLWGEGTAWGAVGEIAWGASLMGGRKNKLLGGRKTSWVFDQRILGAGALA